MKLSWLHAALAAALSIPCPSVAGVLSIEFDLAQSSVVSINGNPEMGQQRAETGSLSLMLTGVDAMGMPTGPGAVASLSDFNATIGIVQQLDAQTRFDRRFEFVRIPTISAGFDGSRVVIDAGQFSGSLHFTSSCTGPRCQTVTTFPNGLNLAVANFTPFVFSLSGLGQAGGASVSGRSIFQTIELQAQGKEIARRFDAPEPSATGFLSAALALLAVRRLLTRASS
jgi:hypothetical protein